MRFEEGEVRELAPGIFLRAGVDNSLWAGLGDGAAVVDGLEDPNLAPVIAAAVRETTGQPIRWVLNTHWHGDHIACNPAWARDGAQVVAHESLGPASRQPDGRPNITFRDRYALGEGPRRAELEWVGGTHTDADTVVYFPGGRVLHVGDLFGWGLVPLREITPRSIARLRAVYQRLLAYEAAVVVPGHGPTLTPGELRRFMEYFDDLLTRVPPLCRAGASLEAVKQAVPPPEDMAGWWRFTDWKHARNLERVCQAGL